MIKKEGAAEEFNTTSNSSSSSSSSSMKREREQERVFIVILCKGKKYERVSARTFFLKMSNTHGERKSEEKV